MSELKVETRNQVENNGDKNEEYLFDAALLKSLNWNEKVVDFKNNISPCHLVNNLCLRPLAASDYWKGYIDLLSQLTVIGTITEEMFLKRFYSMKKSGEYYIMVVEDLIKSMIVGSTTLVIEQKFIRTTTTRGRIEDVVVHEDYRGQQIGKLLVQTAVILSKYLDCYKTSLECKESKVPFYELFSFKADSVFMTIRNHE